MNPTNHNKGLQPLPPDARDYSHAQVFGSVSVNDLPTGDFLVSVPLEIKNQDFNYPSDFCTSYAAAEAAEAEDQVVFVPEYTFAAGKWLLSQAGNPNALFDFGLNLRDICEAAREIGFLPRANDPFRCDTMARPTRNFIANFPNWPEDLAAIAAKYKKPSYFSALTGPHDVFDNIRAALWLNRDSRRDVITGLLWRESWNTAQDGIIPESYEATGSGHAFALIGQKTIAGNIYLVMQSSDGRGSGDNGFFYFSRAVVNREIGPFGAYLLSDMDEDKAAYHATNGVSVYDSIGLRVLRFISKYIHI